MDIINFIDTVCG